MLRLSRVTSEKRSKIGDFTPMRSLWSKISGRRGTPPIIFVRLVRPMNALQLCRWQFSHKETLYQTFFKRSAILYGNRPFCFFETPLGDLGATYNHLKLIGKHVVDLLLVLIELFSLGVTAEELYGRISVENRRFRSNGGRWPEISRRRGRPHQPFFFSEN